MDDSEFDRNATLSISQMARAFDVTPRTLRFYEDKGLLSPLREGQTRLYTHRERGRLKLILQGKRVGLPLDDILEILDLYTLEDGEKSQLFRARERLSKQVLTLTKQREDIELSLQTLTDNLAFLDEQIAKLGTAGPTEKMTAFAKLASQAMDKAQHA